MEADVELLHAYAETRNEEAFTVLVRRNVDLVYSAALRQVGHDSHLAEDVTQSVFTDLARKAALLSSRETIAGWLYTSTHFAASKVVRAERRRRVREQVSHIMQELTSDSSAAVDWRQLDPIIDSVMLELNEKDREAVVLRFFAGRSFTEIGTALQLPPDTARKRVERALDKLHGLLARRGVRSTSGALALAISNHAIAAAPPGLAAAVSGAVLTGTAVSFTTAVVAQLAFMSKLPLAIAAAAIAILSVTLVVQQTRKSAVHQEVVLLRTQHAKMSADIATARKRGVEATAASISASTALGWQENVISPSEITARWGSKEQIRAGLDSSYAPLFRRLKLRPEGTEALKDLLAERVRIASFEVSDFLISAGAAAAEISLAERKEIETVATREIDGRIRALLGEADFEYFRTFERTLQLRAPFLAVADQLKLSAEPLRDDQIEQLVSWTAAEFAGRDGALDVHMSSIVSEDLLARAQAILSPLQLEKLRIYRTSMEALWQIIAVNRAAEAKGMIQAVESHAP